MARSRVSHILAYPRPGSTSFEEMVLAVSDDAARQDATRRRQSAKWRPVWAQLLLQTDQGVSPERRLEVLGSWSSIVMVVLATATVGHSGKICTYAKGTATSKHSDGNATLVVVHACAHGRCGGA